MTMLIRRPLPPPLCVVTCNGQDGDADAQVDHFRREKMHNDVVAWAPMPQVLTLALETRSSSGTGSRRARLRFPHRNTAVRAREFLRSSADTEFKLSTPIDFVVPA